MVYCHNCGEKIPEDALFCPKCGTKTAKGAQANTATPLDEMRDAFTKMSVEMEKAFKIAAKEVENAFRDARSNIQKTINKESIVCSNCEQKNSANATFCFNCGKKLTSESVPKPNEGK